MRKHRAKKTGDGRWLVIVLSGALLLSPVLAQTPAQDTPPKQRASQAQSPAREGTDVKPEDATTALLAAFDRYEVVGMGAAHGNKDLDDFILHLIRNPAFPDKVNDVVVECGNSLYQPILDRYIAGGDVSLSEVRPVWRNTTAQMCSVSGFYEVLFPLVRRINQRLPPERRIRMLAGDPPLDWSKVTDQSEVTLNRDATTASVMEREVLSKHRKALMLFGEFHLFHSNKIAPRGLESAVQRYEKDYPGVTLVIGDLMVFTDSDPPEKDEWEARTTSWPFPALIQNIQGTWLGDMDKTYFSKMVDAYLYLGPTELMLIEPRPAEMFSNKGYMQNFAEDRPLLRI